MVKYHFHCGKERNAKSSFNLFINDFKLFFLSLEKNDLWQDSKKCVRSYPQNAHDLTSHRDVTGFPGYSCRREYFLWLWRHTTPMWKDVRYLRIMVVDCLASSSPVSSSTCDSESSSVCSFILTANQSAQPFCPSTTSPLRLSVPLRTRCSHRLQSLTPHSSSTCSSSRSTSDPPLTFQHVSHTHHAPGTRGCVWFESLVVLAGWCINLQLHFVIEYIYSYYL